MASAANKTQGSRAVVSAGILGGVASSRRNIAIVVLVAALLAAAIGMAVLNGGLGGSIFNGSPIGNLFDRGTKALVQGARAAGNSPLVNGIASLFDQRSPGERTAGELLNSKHRYAQIIRHYPARPHQRALAKTRPGLPAPFVKALTIPPQEIAPVALPPESLVAPLVQNIPLPDGSFVSPPFIGGGGPGGGGGGPPGGGGGPPGGVGGPPPTGVPPVPEPATWLTMILGFALCARALRKQRVATGRVRFITA